MEKRSFSFVFFMTMDVFYLFTCTDFLFIVFEEFIGDDNGCSLMFEPHFCLDSHEESIAGFLAKFFSKV